MTAKRLLDDGQAIGAVQCRGASDSLTNAVSPTVNISKTWPLQSGAFLLHYRHKGRLKLGVLGDHILPSPGAPQTRRALACGAGDGIHTGAGGDTTVN